MPQEIFVRRHSFVNKKMNLHSLVTSSLIQVGSVYVDPDSGARVEVGYISDSVQIGTRSLRLITGSDKNGKVYTRKRFFPIDKSCPLNNVQSRVFEKGSKYFVKSTDKGTPSGGTLEVLDICNISPHDGTAQVYTVSGILDGKFVAFSHWIYADGISTCRYYIVGKIPALYDYQLEFVRGVHNKSR